MVCVPRSGPSCAPGHRRPARIGSFQTRSRAAEAIASRACPIPTLGARRTARPSPVRAASIAVPRTVRVRTTLFAAGSTVTKITLAGLACTAAMTSRSGEGQELAATCAPESRRRTSLTSFSESTSTSRTPMNEVLPNATVAPSGESAGATA